MVRSRLCWGSAVPSIFAASSVGNGSVDMMAARLGVDLVGLWEGLFADVAVLALLVDWFCVNARTLIV